MTNRNNDIVIAGAGAEGHGVYAGHREGTGPMTYERYTELCDRAGVDPAQRMPARQAKTQLNRAVRAVATRRGLLPRPGTRMLTELRPNAGRWLLVGALAPAVAAAPDAVSTPNSLENLNDSEELDAVVRAAIAGEPDAVPTPEPSASDSLVGQAYGTILLQVTLYDEPSPTGEGRTQTIDFRGDETLAAQVKAQYDANVGAQLFQAEDITGWLNRYYRDALTGVMSGPAWYIPREHRAAAEAICEAFSTHGGWGTGWFDPPVPCATSAQLGVGMARSLCAEVGVHLAELARARAERVAKGEQDITPKKAEGFAIRLGMVRRRVDFHRATLGDAYGECIASIEDAMIELDSALEGGATGPQGQIRDFLAERDAAEAASLAATAALVPVAPKGNRVVTGDQVEIPFGDLGVSFEDAHTSSTEVTDLPGYMY